MQQKQQQKQDTESDMQQQQQQKSQDRSPIDKEDLLFARRVALLKLQEAVDALNRYNALTTRNPEEPDLGIREFVRETLLPLTLGPPGQVCDTCGGSGRKP